MKTLYILFLFSNLFSDAIDVKTFFPSKELEQKKFVYEIHGMPMSQCIETFTVKNSCVVYHREYGALVYISKPIKINEKVDENSQKKNVIDNPFYDYTICWSEDLVYPQNNINSPLLTQKDKWLMELEVNEGKSVTKELTVPCQVVQKDRKTIFGKTRNTIKTQCSGVLESYNVFAEGLGIIESGMEDNFIKLIEIK